MSTKLPHRIIMPTSGNTFYTTNNCLEIVKSTYCVLNGNFLTYRYSTKNTWLRNHCCIHR